MLELLSLLLGPWFWRVHSLFIKGVLRAKGIRVGKNFYIEGVPRLKIRGKARNIVLGNSVSILGNIDLRNRENGMIIFRDGVTVEGNCRFVSAREGRIEVGEGTVITAFGIFNGGADIVIGRQCVIGPRASINANEHLFVRGRSIREQGFVHAPVWIGDGCWTGAGVVITKGVHLAPGTVVGALAVVTKDTEENGIYVGVPALKIGERPVA